MKPEAAHYSQANEACLFLLGQDFERHAERVRALQKTAPIGSLAHGAGGRGPDRFGAVAPCHVSKIGQNFEPGLDGLRIEFSSAKHILSQANRPAVLGEYPVMFWVIDGGNLPTKRIAANVDHCEMICHSTSSHTTRNPI